MGDGTQGTGSVAGSSVKMERILDDLLKKLLYLLAVDGPKAPNVSQLASDIQTSRATVMNYIKYLADARLTNIIYTEGQDFPKKPAKVMMHNPNLMYAIYPIQNNDQDVMETFFVNSLWKDHKVNQASKEFIEDGGQTIIPDFIKTKYPEVCQIAEEVGGVVGVVVRPVLRQLLGAQDQHGLVA